MLTPAGPLACCLCTASVLGLAPAIAQDAAPAPAAAPPAPAAAPAAAAATPPAAAPDPDFAVRIDEMLAAAWLGDLYPLTRDPDITDEGYRACLAMALRCARLAPNRRLAWDLSLLLAEAVEPGAPDAARAARREALAALTRIDPADDVIRLARVADAIDAHPTADARVRAYEQVLSDAGRSALGPAVSARLAYQLASLQSRMGNSELYARWLAESVKVDPSFPLAAQAAAGFFRMRVDDPAADVELLSIAVEANPRDLDTWSALVTVLLDGGAFRGAERAARMAIAVAEAERRNEAVYALTGDLATALWGGGRQADAMRELELRMGRLTDDYRRMISLMDPTITIERLNREFPPVPSTLAVAMLGLAKRQGDAAKLDQLLERAIRGTDTEIRRAKDRGDSEQAISAYDVQKLTAILLFAPNVTPARALIDGLSKSGALGDAGKARFEAMLAWRQGKLEDAIKALAPLSADDPLARYAHACALAEAKRTQEASAEFRALAESHIGTSIGLLALDRLAEALGQPSLVTPQLSAAVAARAKSLDEALAAHLPKSVDDLVESPMRALTVELVPSSLRVGPYEPLTFAVRMRNNSRLPLAIGGDAPISGSVTMRSAAPSPGREGTGELPPQPILVDRRLRLMPGEQIEVKVDADLTITGMLLAIEPLDPHFVTLAIVSNPASVTGGLAPGFLGTITECQPIQFSGVAVTAEWIAESRALIRQAGRVEAVKRLALLAHAGADPKRLPEAVRPESKAIWAEVTAAWKALPERAQAWVVGVLPTETPDMAPLMEAARASTSPAVLRSWIITRITDPKDPLLDVGRRSGDAELAELAESVTWTVDRRAARAAEEIGTEAERARTQPKDSGSR